MGVCKCKQRNVTNQFCYVCRMNVCESCIVKNHQRCIIKSYVHWLQDSDFSATCSLCLESIENGEVLRLSCYDLFHWDCFNKWALKFPENTPASGYQCPDCKAHVFPSDALVSPVADVIRQRFSTVAWGRRGLGMKPQLKAETHTHVVPQEIKQVLSTPSSHIVQTSTSTPKTSYKPLANSIKTPFVPLSKQQPQQQHHQQQTQIHQQSMPVTATYSREKTQNDVTTSRKLVDTTRYNDEKINMTYDHDDNKYKRKGFAHWLGNILKLNKKPVTMKKEANLTFKRVLMMLVLFVIGFMTVVYFLSKYGRELAGSDPMLDPNFNPNIRVQAQEHF